jgi:predicted nucleotidyltransferase
MRVTGIIAEYNPFHNGHDYHMRRAREVTGADFIVIVLSGPFTQRGEPAVVDKWARARMALSMGADLVLELPFAFATQSAEWFARASVTILDRTRTVTDICFGMESESLLPLQEIARTAAKESKIFRKALKNSLREGQSFPAARADALAHCIEDGGLKEMVKQPNNILAVEYLKSLILLKSAINPVGIVREGTGYHAETAEGKYASASHLRHMIGTGEWESVSSYMPDTAYAVLRECADTGNGPVFSAAYNTAVLSCLRRATSQGIAQWPDVSEGLENRLTRLAQETDNIEELCEAAATRRYTRARIRRILTYGFAGLTKKTLDNYKKAGGPGYLRVLGFKKSAVSLLKAIRQNASLPLVMSPAKALKEMRSKQARSQLLLDIRAQNLYALGMPSPDARTGNMDYYRPYIIMS